MDDFYALRPYLFSIAYRMLGSAMDAEDVLQDAYLRWSDAERGAVRSHKAFLATIVTRLSLNRLTSARAGREAYVGVWLPEPLLTDADSPWSSPEAEVGAKESLSLAFMLLMETLNPDERTVYVLRTMFDYDYAEIADIIEKTAANCRQLFHRAREKIAGARAADTVSRESFAQIAAAVTDALGSGDIAALTGLLAADAVSIADGGGKVRGASTRPVHGAAAVAAVLRVVFARGMEMGATFEPAEINGQMGFVSRVDGVIYSVGVIEMRGGLLSRLLFIVNPDKLRWLNHAG